MEAVFIKVLNMSMTASWLILAVILLRFLLKKAPKWIMCILWAFVAVRLICPISIESITSLIPSAEMIQEDIGYSENPAITTGVPFVNDTVNPIIQNSFAPDATASVNPMQIFIFAAAIVWAIGVTILIGYAMISYLRLQYKVSTAVRLKDDLWQSEAVDSPFILGIIRPQIYLPFQLEEEQQEYVVAHERAHLTRKDYLWKPLGFMILSVYWFNPLCWIAYWLLCKDIELACDEKVIKDFDLHSKKQYSQTLIACSTSRSSIAAYPLAFGETDVKKRIQNVLSYKKPAFWMILLSVLVCTVVAICFLTDPKSERKEQEAQDISMNSEGWAEKVPDDYTLEDALEEDLVIIADGDVLNGQEKWTDFVEQTSKGKAASIKVVHYYTLGDKSHYDEAYYESIKDEYPQLYIMYLSYNGEQYTIAHYEGEQLYVEKYRYLMRYEGEAIPTATYTSYVRYVLIDDNTVTWDDIWRGMISSQLGDAIAHESVYTDVEYK